MIIYILKSLLCSGMLLLFYHIFLEREKMHRANRFYLLASIVFSLIIPTVQIGVESEIPVLRQNFAIDMLAERTLSPVIAETPATGIKTETLPVNIPALVYAGITIVLLMRFAKNLRFILQKKSNRKTVEYHGAKLVLVAEDIVTYTFLNNIFVPEKAYIKNKIKPEILIHELTHARQKHSLDIIFIELVNALFWINPLLLFYKKAIQLNHEFLADEAVLQRFDNTKSYQLLLLDTILYTRKVNLTSSFNFSITKKRLAMMTKSTSRLQRTGKQLAATLLFLGLAFTLSEKIYGQAPRDVQTSRTKKLSEGEARSTNPVTPTTRSYKPTPGKGLAPELMAEFNKTVAQHRKNMTTSSGRKFVRLNLTIAQKKRMYTLFQEMDRNQQEATNLNFFETEIPVRKSPGDDVFELWKNPAVFGVWIDNKKVSNKELSKYKSSDIAEFWLSKLYGAAKKGRSYKYQLDLTTNAEFDKTYQSRVDDRILISTVHRPNKQ